MGHHPTLAEDFDSLRQELYSPLPPLEPISADMLINQTSLSINEHLQAQQSAIRRRNKVAQDLDNMLVQIRQKPGFENFLRAESEAYLLSAALEGPIVVLNVTKLRSDAILLTKGQVTSIALPYLSHDSMIEYFAIKNTKLKNRNEFKSRLLELLQKAPEHSPDLYDSAIECFDKINTGPEDGNELKRKLLEWLWKAAVQPVLQKLGFYPGSKEGSPLPRIWWIGIGLIAQAPIHAATKFTKGRIKMTTL